MKKKHEKLLDIELPSPNKALVQIDPLKQYMVEIRKYKLLAPDEQKNLAIRFKENGDAEAAQLLVVSNLRLVIKIALDFQRVWMQNLLDLIQEGNLGLMQAVVKFDPYRDVKFSYYASFWIKAYILKFIMDNWRLVKIGTTQSQRRLFFNLNKEKQKLINEGFEPEPKLLSQKLGFPDKKVIEMDQRLNSWDVSLNAPLKDDSNTEMINFIPAKSTTPEEQIANKEIKSLLHEKINEFKITTGDQERLAPAVLRETLKTIITLLFPMVPHFCEELWQQAGQHHQLNQALWPQHNAETAREEELTIVVQVNGKVRSKLQVAADIDDQSLQQAALAEEKIAALLNNQKPKKIIVVKKKLVNIVL